MKIVASALAMVLFQAIASAQSMDVDGWDGAKWGMTLAQVKVAITYNLERDPRFVSASGGTVYRTAEPFTLLDFPVRANFAFSPNENKLVSVEVQIDSHFLETGQPPLQPFERFRQSLIEKYGQPTFTDDGGRIVFWKFASSVTFQRAEVGGKPFVGVTYKKTSR